MKFLALKEALEEALPPSETAERSQPVPALPSIQFFSPAAKRQRVVGGDIIRIPIDRTAAMVIAKAPWWAMPPAEPFEPIAPVSIPTEQPKPKTRKVKRMSQIPVTHPSQSPGTDVIKDKANDVLNAELALTAYAKAGKSVTEADQLLAKAMDARAALDVMSELWKKSWFDFVDASDQRLTWLRQTRMAFDTETRVLMAQLRDVRQFFLDKTHEQEVARLKEFVDLCERLQKLKSSGFLDTVADTLIRLT